MSNITYSILVGCDQAYHDTWTRELFKSIHHRNPWIKLRCNIVNPENLQKLDYVEYFEDFVDFKSDEAKISYLQSSRFIAGSKIPMDENFITLDADTICTRAFLHTDFAQLFNNTYVLRHHKDNRWLAGLVSFGQNGFRHEYAEMLLTETVEEWKWGRDQTILATLAKKYNFTPVSNDWMMYGKTSKQPPTFITLKGEQKITDKYLRVFNQFKI